MAIKSKRNLFTLFGNFAHNPGSVPGSLDNIPEEHTGPLTINVQSYAGDYHKAISVNSVDECKRYLQEPSKTWIRIQGLGDTEKLTSVWNHFDLHPLIREDIINTVQRPKMEQYENCIFIVMRTLQYTSDRQNVESRQISFVLGDGYLLSFQENNQPIFNPVIERLDNANNRIRSEEIDYLAYALIDNVVDHCFMFLDDLNEQLEQIEEKLLDDPDKDTLEQIHSVRKDVIIAHKSMWPTKNILSRLTGENTRLIKEDTKLYFRDVHDHIIQVIDNIENFREMTRSMYDMHTSEANRKMNDIMKVLTIVATIFIPLTFIAGIYGMNFNPESSPLNMPGLNWYWGYPACLALMFVVAVAMIIYFRRKGWL